MPSAKTECTELAIGFGILGLNPLDTLTENGLESYFTGTLDYSQYENFRTEYAANKRLYEKFHQIGAGLKRSYFLFRDAKIRNIKWEGPNKQATTVSVAKDLEVLNTPISVKAKSDVVVNPSPRNLFYALPQGHLFRRRSQNWYLYCAPTEYQTLYKYARDTWQPELPEDASIYHKRGVVREDQRGQFSYRIKQSEKEKSDEFRSPFVPE